MSRKPGLVVAVTDPMGAILLRGQLSYARSKGFDVTLLSAPGARARQVAREEGVSLAEINMAREIAPLRDLWSLLQIIFFLARTRPLIVNAGTPKAGMLVVLAAWLCRTPGRFYTLRGLRLETATGWLRVVLVMMERMTCTLANRVICVSPALRRRAIELGVLNADKATVLHKGSSNGINIERFTLTERHRSEAAEIRKRFGIPDDGLVVGFIGRIVRDKGIVELAGAWQMLREEFPTAHLLLVGPVEAGDPVPPEVLQALHDDPSVHLTGSVEDIVPYYPAMSLLVLPTYREGFSNVLLEAAAMELPIVATRVTGCIDGVQDGITGTLVPARNIPELAKAIRAYLRNPELRHKQAQAGRERVVNDFQPVRIWEAQVQEYTRLLREKNLPLPDEEPLTERNSALKAAQKDR